MSRSITDLCRDAYLNSKEKGFHDKGSEFGTLIALVHSELSEALEAYRTQDDGYSHGPFDPIYLSKDSGKLTREPGAYVWVLDGHHDGEPVQDWVPNKPEGVRAELADVCIRIFDMCGLYGLDLEKAIEEKMAYNKTRPRLHGNKKF